MDYQRFTEQLPNLYDSWGQNLVRPKSNQFQQIFEQVGGSTTINLMQLLNFAIDCMEPDEIYCEIGFSQEANLIGALLNHPSRMAYIVDNFSEFDSSGQTFNKLIEHLSAFDLEEQVFLCNQEFEEFLFELRQFKTENRIGVYSLNCPRDYRSLLLGLLLVRPLLADQALIIIGNTNSIAVHQATLDFIASHPQCKILLDLQTLIDKISTLYNGIHILSWNTNQTNNYELSYFVQQENEEFTKEIYNWENEYENRKSTLDKLLKEAIKLEDFTLYKNAEEKYEEILRWNPNDIQALFNLGMLYYKTERHQQSLDLLVKSLDLCPSNKRYLYYYSIGLVLEKLGKIPQAIQAYQQTIALEPQWIDTYNNLGNIFFYSGELEQAETFYHQAITTQPEHFGSYLNLGNVLMRQGKFEQAIKTYQTALNLQPYNSDITYNLALAFTANNCISQASLYYANYHYLCGAYEEAIKYYHQFLETNNGDTELYLTLAKCRQKLNQHEEAINIYRQAIELYPKDGNLYFKLALALQDFGQLQEAINVVTEASKLLPTDLYLRHQRCLLLPIIYETEAEIDFHRHRYINGLGEFIQETFLDSSESIKNAFVGIGRMTNFYLQYQGKDDLELQKRYGKFVHQVMSANYPQWAKPLHIPPRTSKDKIRIGYVSECMRRHTVGVLMLGWLSNCNHKEFEIYSYYTDSSRDQLTKQFQISSDAFHHIPDALEAVCKQIIADQLHILVYLDIGMHPQITLMAGLRLAPVQCTTWGHPITSGIPTIDYFLSSDLMEPENADKHYSERLIRLPNIGISYSKPVIPEITKNRADFQLRDDAVVYLSCQSLFKYLPQYDYIFAAIAQEVPQAQFAFLSHPSEHITRKLRQRLQRAFANFGLHSEERCVILPRQNTPGYLSLNLVSDVFLDTFSWSGGNTTLEAIACNLPVVTCPGEFMRGRHSYGILQMLGVTDTIAKNEAEYIEIAVRLGLDREWRDSIVERMIKRHSFLYEDKSCVEALEAFYRYVVQDV